MRPPRIYRTLLLALIILTSSAVANGHEIPSDITAHVFIKPEGQRVRLLVRIPLRAMRDIDFPNLGPGYLDTVRVEPMLRDAVLLWLAPNVELREEGDAVDGQRFIRARLSLPSDRSFVSFNEAIAHVSGSQLPTTERVPWESALVDVLFEYPIQSSRSHFAVHFDFSRLAARVTTVVRFVHGDGTVRAFEYAGDPGWIELDPRWHQAAWTFVQLGLFHILDGIDHLLFLLCLVVPIRRIRTLVLIVTAFTVGHSITLIGSAFGFAPEGLWFPPLVETLIAASIAYMALENILVEWQGGEAATANRLSAAVLHRRWILAFLFGLVHGFGFSFALRESLQFAGSHLLASLLSFNLGVELGQVLVLTVLVPCLAFVFHRVVPERIGAIVISVLIAHTSWHWMADRWRTLQAYSWPTIDALTLASTLRWVTVALLIAGVAWALTLRQAQGKLLRQAQGKPPYSGDEYGRPPVERDVTPRRSS